MEEEQEEPIADIVAGKREKEAASAQPCEAAHGEKSPVLDKTGGIIPYNGGKVNAAAVREALIKVREWMEHRIITCGFEPSATFPTVLEDVVLPALSAPPRNCDYYTTDKEAWLAWEKHCEDTDMYDDVDEVDLYGHWLFATADEGGSDGSR